MLNRVKWFLASKDTKTQVQNHLAAATVLLSRGPRYVDDGHDSDSIYAFGVGLFGYSRMAYSVSAFMSEEMKEMTRTIEAQTKKPDKRAWVPSEAPPTDGLRNVAGIEF
ncbi:hypothetical protein LTR85_010757 [Meristemomyces frigidus]|nr:hypothetical protein LTR85_010757 [Meristemomyces frigidus]